MTERGKGKPGKPKAGKPLRGARGLKVRVKTASAARCHRNSGSSASSTILTLRAPGARVIARAPPYKLAEIDDKARFLEVGARVIDLGAAPGGWSQVAAKRVGAPGQGRVVAIDLLAMEPVAGVEFVQPGFPRSRGAGDAESHAGRAGRRGALRHGGQRHRPRAGPIISRSWRWSKPPPNSRTRCWRRAAHSSPRCCKAAPRRRARRAQARFRGGETRQAGGEPRRFGRALSAGDRVSRLVLDVAHRPDFAEARVARARHAAWSPCRCHAHRRGTRHNAAFFSTTCAGFLAFDKMLWRLRDVGDAWRDIAFVAPVSVTAHRAAQSCVMLAGDARAPWCVAVFCRSMPSLRSSLCRRALARMRHVGFLSVGRRLRRTLFVSRLYAPVLLLRRRLLCTLAVWSPAFRPVWRPACRLASAVASGLRSATAFSRPPSGARQCIARVVHAMVARQRELIVGNRIGRLAGLLVRQAALVIGSARFSAQAR